MAKKTVPPPERTPQHIDPLFLRRLEFLESERHLNGRWDALCRILEKWSPPEPRPMSRPAVDPALADVRRGLDAIYTERYVNGRWAALAQLIVEWAPHRPPAQSTPPPAPNVIILDERVRQRQTAAREAARREEA